MGCSTALVVLMLLLDCTLVARFGKTGNASSAHLNKLQTSSIFSNVLQLLTCLFTFLMALL